METDWKAERNKIIGLGENSFKKNYYPELQNKIEQLETSQRNLENILNSVSDSIIIHDKSGRVLYLNSQALILLNAKEGDSLTVMDISSPKCEVEKLSDIWNYVEQRKSLTLEWIVLQSGTNKEIPVQVSVNNILWNSAKCFVAVVRDFTERKEYEEKLIKAKLLAEESDQLKTAFLQNMSHEIRTPMNAIMGFSELLNNDSLSSEKKNEYTSIITNSCILLLSVVNNILDISTLETKQEKVRITEVLLNEVMEQLFLIFFNQAAAKKLKFNFFKDIDKGDPHVYTDKTKVTQILTNLLNNALKFTAEGFVEYGYVIKGDKIEFYVRDSGIGIRPEMHKKIFERFRQADSSIQANFGGTGLGLAISKELVALLGGDIWVESGLNDGSTFYFTINYEPVSEADTKYVESMGAISGSKTILIAEDEEYNYLYLVHLLQKMDIKIIRTQNGLETIEICKSDPSIDLILMDIKMPVMDGYTAAKLIKAFRPQLPIIAQTAYALDSEVKKFEGPAFDDYITKPINKDVLSQKVLKSIHFNDF